MKKQTTILTLLSIVILAAFGWHFIGANGIIGENSPKHAILEDPIDLAMELYTPWFANLKESEVSVDPMEILDSSPLTEDLRTRLKQEINNPLSDMDPIICQQKLPERIGAKTIFVNETQAQLIIVARGEKVPEQALVDLEAVGDKWLISNIVCSGGEVGKDVEFNFINDGNILKQSLQPPLDSNKWHLIYTKEDVSGHVVPLIFDSSSVCIDTQSGEEQVCADNQLTEAAEVSIKGAMQEAGVLVQIMELK